MFLDFFTLLFRNASDKATNLDLESMRACAHVCRCTWRAAGLSLVGVEQQTEAHPTSSAKLPKKVTIVKYQWCLCVK